MDLALFSGMRAVDSAAVLRAVAVPMFRAAVDLEKLAGGVILLTVGREATPAGGLAAGRLAFAPSTLARVGEMPGLLILALERLRTALGVILAMFPRTGRPRSSVLPETAVRPLALA